MQQTTAFWLGIFGAIAFIIVIAVVGITWPICGRKERFLPQPANTDGWPSNWYSRLAGAVGVRGAGMNFRGWTPEGGDGGDRNRGHELNTVKSQYIPARTKLPQRPLAVVIRVGIPKFSVAQVAKPPPSTEGERFGAKASVQQDIKAIEIRLHVPGMDEMHRKLQTEPPESQQPRSNT